MLGFFEYYSHYGVYISPSCVLKYLEYMPVDADYAEHRSELRSGRNSVAKRNRITTRRPSMLRARAPPANG